MTFPGIILFRDNNPPSEDGAPKPERVTKGDPRFRSWNHYTDTSERFFSGVWESSPGQWRIEYDETEFCAILSGRSVIHSDDGQQWDVGAGDSFVIPAGFKGRWEVIETTRKLYVIVYLSGN